jgi:hypothetical protein
MVKVSPFFRVMHVCSKVEVPVFTVVPLGQLGADVVPLVLVFVLAVPGRAQAISKTLPKANAASIRASIRQYLRAIILETSQESIEIRLISTKKMLSLVLRAVDNAIKIASTPLLAMIVRLPGGRGEHGENQPFLPLSLHTIKLLASIWE